MLGNLIGKKIDGREKDINWKGEEKRRISI